MSVAGRKRDKGIRKIFWVDQPFDIDERVHVTRNGREVPIKITSGNLVIIDEVFIGILEQLTRSSPRRTYLCDGCTSVATPSPKYGNALLVRVN